VGSSSKVKRNKHERGKLWKLPRLMEMRKIEIRKGNIFQTIFHIPTAAWKTLHSTAFHSEFSTVPTASAARYTSPRRETGEDRRCPRLVPNVKNWRWSPRSWSLRVKRLGLAVEKRTAAG
jgi:hypothetical protein